MDLNPQESNLVIALLTSEQRSIDEILSEFTLKIDRSRRFTVCNSILLLSQDKKILKSPERLIAFAILHQAYSSQPSSANPFISYIAACDEQAEKCEREFILQLLASGDSNYGREFFKSSVANFVNAFDPSAHVFPLREKMQQQYCDKVHSKTYGSFIKNAAVKNVIWDPDEPRNRDANSPEFDLQPKLGSGDRDETLDGLLLHLSSEGISPRWMRPHPPILPVQDGELVWLDPYNNHGLVWDHGMCVDTSRGIRDLISKALKGALAPAQEEQVLVELENDPKLVYHCRLTPRRLPELVVNNPLIAVGVLTKMRKAREIFDYFTVLFNMDTSPHSMEVVNLLTTAVEIPKKFVHTYITNCISSYENIEDKYMKYRQVRFVCVFLQSLIRNKIIDDEELFIKVQAFCNKFYQN